MSHYPVTVLAFSPLQFGPSFSTSCISKPCDLIHHFSRSCIFSSPLLQQRLGPSPSRHWIWCILNGKRIWQQLLLPKYVLVYSQFLCVKASYENFNKNSLKLSTAYLYLHCVTSADVSWVAQATWSCLNSVNMSTALHECEYEHEASVQCYF